MLNTLNTSYLLTKIHQIQPNRNKNCPPKGESNKKAGGIKKSSAQKLLFHTFSAFIK
jgi:hypothetical protein